MLHYTFVGSIPVDDAIPVRLPQDKLTKTGESHGLVAEKRTVYQKKSC